MPPPSPRNATTRLATQSTTPAQGGPATSGTGNTTTATPVNPLEQLNGDGFDDTWRDAVDDKRLIVAARWLAVMVAFSSGIFLCSGIRMLRWLVANRSRKPSQELVRHMTRNTAATVFAGGGMLFAHFLIDPSSPSARRWSLFAVWSFYTTLWFITVFSAMLGGIFVAIQRMLVYWLEWEVYLPREVTGNIELGLDGRLNVLAYSRKVYLLCLQCVCHRVNFDDYTPRVTKYLREKEIDLAVALVALQWYDWVPLLCFVLINAMRQFAVTLNSPDISPYIVLEDALSYIFVMGYVPMFLFLGLKQMLTARIWQFLYASELEIMKRLAKIETQKQLRATKLRAMADRAALDVAIHADADFDTKGTFTSPDTAQLQHHANMFDPANYLPLKTPRFAQGVFRSIIVMMALYSAVLIMSLGYAAVTNMEGSFGAGVGVLVVGFLPPVVVAFNTPFSSVLIVLVSHLGSRLDVPAAIQTFTLDHAAETWHQEVWVKRMKCRNEDGPGESTLDPEKRLHTIRKEAEDLTSPLLEVHQIQRHNPLLKLQHQSLTDLAKQQQSAIAVVAAGGGVTEAVVTDHSVPQNGGDGRFMGSGKAHRKSSKKRDAGGGRSHGGAVVPLDIMRHNLDKCNERILQLQAIRSKLAETIGLAAAKRRDADQYTDYLKDCVLRRPEVSELIRERIRLAQEEKIADEKHKMATIRQQPMLKGMRNPLDSPPSRNGDLSASVGAAPTHNGTTTSGDGRTYLDDEGKQYVILRSAEDIGFVFDNPAVRSNVLDAATLRRDYENAGRIPTSEELLRAIREPFEKEVELKHRLPGRAIPQFIAGSHDSEARHMGHATTAEWEIQERKNAQRRRNELRLQRAGLRADDTTLRMLEDIEQQRHKEESEIAAAAALLLPDAGKDDRYSDWGADEPPLEAGDGSNGAAAEDSAVEGEAKQEASKPLDVDAVWQRLEMLGAQLERLDNVEAYDNWGVDELEDAARRRQAELEAQKLLYLNGYYGAEEKAKEESGHAPTAATSSLSFGERDNGFPAASTTSGVPHSAAASEPFTGFSRSTSVLSSAAPSRVSVAGGSVLAHTSRVHPPAASVNGPHNVPQRMPADDPDL